MKGGDNFTQRDGIKTPCNDHMAKKIKKRRSKKDVAKQSRKQNRSK